MVDSEVKVESFVKEVPDVAWQLIEVSDKPLTIVYDGARNLAPNLIAEDGSIGIRITREEFSRNLCLRMKKPIVSTSANVSGKPSPLCFNEISKEILDAVDYVCTSRREEKNAAGASSVIKLGNGGEIKILRP